MARLRRTIQYYSSWNHFKEIFLIPHRRKPKGSAKLTLRQSGSKTERGSPKSKTKASDGVKTSTEQLSSTKSKSGTERLKEVPPTSPAREVEDYLFNEVYFTHSKEPRNVRPRNLKFRVGQVVRHRQDKYHGVIVGWDLIAKVMVDNLCVCVLLHYA